MKTSKIKADKYIHQRFKLNQKSDSPKIIANLNRRGLVSIWKNLGYKIGCEVGVAAGYFTNLMFKGIPGLKMYLVEPYFDYQGGKKYNELHDEYAGQAFPLLKNRDVEWIHELSETAYKKVKNNSLDFVYIDANHSYDYVMMDIILWIRKVRPGGIISGHDYETDGRRRIRDVKKAVDDYNEMHKIRPWYLTDVKPKEHRSDRHASWFWVKKKQ